MFSFDDIEIGDVLENKTTKETSLVMGKCKEYRINYYSNKTDKDDVIFVIDSKTPENFYNGMFYFNKHNISSTFNLIKCTQKKPSKGGCSCDIMVLMSTGCKCGNFTTQTP
jgi:hypothetical protein